MPYTLSDIADNLAIDREFDRFDWQFRNGEFDYVQHGCSEVVNDPRASNQKISWASLLLGEIELTRSQPQRALDHLERVVDLPKPLIDRLTAARCKGLLHVGRSDEAWMLAQRLIGEFANSWRAWEALARCQQARGDEAGAWRSLLQAARLNPAAGSVLAAIIEVGSAPERAAELASTLLAYLSAQPLALNVRVTLFTCLIHLGEIGKAIDQARRVISFAPLTVIDEDVVDGVRNALEQLYQLQGRQ